MCLRHFGNFLLVLDCFKLAFEALPVLLFTLCVMLTCFSSLIYVLEDRSNIESMPMAMYLAIITLTTVGYGDLTPTSTGGTITCSIIGVIGVIYMTIPLGMVGNACIIRLMMTMMMMMMVMIRSHFGSSLWPSIAHARNYVACDGERGTG